MSNLEVGLVYLNFTGDIRADLFKWDAGGKVVTVYPFHFYMARRGLGKKKKSNFPCFCGLWLKLLYY